MNLINYINEINDKIIGSDNEECLKASVSELMIHKILYITYGAFYKKFNKELFVPKFVAWKYGPVEIEYRKMNKENKDVKSHFEINVNDEEKEFLQNLISRLLWSSPWFLVELTHDTKAWSKNYVEGCSNEIPNNEIQESFQNVLI